MQTFKDRHDETWQIELSIGAAEQLKAPPLSCDLLDFTVGGADAAVVRLEIDVATIVAALHVLCAGQIEERGMTAAEFNAALSGEAYARAKQALRAEIANFFRCLGRTADVRALERTTEIWQEMQAAAAARMEGITLETLTPATPVTAGASSGSLPES